MGKKLTHGEFVLKAIDALHNPNFTGKGIHSVYSGLNSAFREYFPNTDPVAAMKALVTEGVIKTRPCKGGVIVYKPADYQAKEDSATKALGKMGLQ